MCPIYLHARGAASLAMHRVPTMLWFVHPADTLTLRVAERALRCGADSVPGLVPATRVRRSNRSATRSTPKRSRGRRSDHRDRGSLRLLALGRTSPVKGYDVMIRAVAAARDAGVSAELRIVGPSRTALERRHRDELQCAGRAAARRVQCTSTTASRGPRSRRCSARADVVAQRHRSGKRRQGRVRGDGRRSSGAGEQLGRSLRCSLIPRCRSRFPTGDATVLADRISHDRVGTDRRDREHDACCGGASKTSTRFSIRRRTC